MSSRVIADVMSLICELQRVRCDYNAQCSYMLLILYRMTEAEKSKWAQRSMWQSSNNRWTQMQFDENGVCHSLLCHFACNNYAIFCRETQRNKWKKKLSSFHIIHVWVHTFFSLSYSNGKIKWRDVGFVWCASSIVMVIPLKIFWIFQAENLTRHKFFARGVPHSLTLLDVISHVDPIHQKWETAWLFLHLHWIFHGTWK